MLGIIHQASSWVNLLDFWKLTTSKTLSTLGMAVRPAVLSWRTADLLQLEICDEDERGRHSW